MFFAQSELACKATVRVSGGKPCLSVVQRTSSMLLPMHMSVHVTASGWQQTEPELLMLA